MKSDFQYVSQFELFNNVTCREQSTNEFTESDIISLLNEVMYIKEKEQRLMDNEGLVLEILGDSYIKNYDYRQS